MPTPTATAEVQGAATPTDRPIRQGVTPRITPTVRPTLPTASPEATAYLDAALDIMEQHLFIRKEIDWPALRTRAKTHDLMRGAQTPTDTYPVIDWALLQLGDRHNRLLSPRQVQFGQVMTGFTNPSGWMVNERVGYIKLPDFGASGEAGESYAAIAQQFIRDLDSKNPCGWIVDLSENFGGNMWPMLAGIGPVLGEGLAGYFVDADGVKTPWYYEDGKSKLGDTIVAQIKGKAYRLKASQPPVAVLTSSRTASSGEAVVVAFRGRPNARSFGGATYGVPTGLEGFTLNDGAMLRLTTVLQTDRNGKLYGESILPDEQNPSPSTALKAATEWLLKQPACRIQELAS